MRYQIYPFFNSTVLSAEGEPKQITPYSNNRQIKSTNKTPIILGVVGGFFLVLIVSALATGRRLKSAIFRQGNEGMCEGLCSKHF